MLETLTLIFKNISYISFALFVLIYYLGIVGFQNIGPFRRWSAVIFLTLFVITFIPYYIMNFIYEIKYGKDIGETFDKKIVNSLTQIKKDDKEYDKDKDKNKNKSMVKTFVEHIIPPIILIILYFWVKWNISAPIYGEYEIYNIFLGRITGKKIISNSTKNKNKNNMVGGNIGDIFNKVYAWFITILSSAIYIFGLDLIKGSQMISTIFSKTLAKMILGYVPKNNSIEDGWFSNFVQKRIASEGIGSKIASFIRKFGLIGLDMDTLDSIFRTEPYNNLNNDNMYYQNKKEFEQRLEKGQTSMLERWKWETWPFVNHWLWLSSIGYILGTILMIIMVFV